MGGRKKKNKDSDEDSDDSSSSSSSSDSDSSSDSSSSSGSEDNEKRSSDDKKKKKKGKQAKKSKQKAKKEGKKDDKSSEPEVKQEQQQNEVRKVNLKANGKKRRNRNMRKRATTIDSDDEETSAHLADAKMLQKARRRGGGINFENDPEEEGAELEVVTQHQLQSVGKAGQRGGLVESGISGTFKNEVSEHVVVNEQMEKYIKEKIQERRGGKADDENGEVQKTAEDELYEIPDFLRQEADKDVEESGDRWLAGIAEVELPISVKLANIERTETAKADLIKQKEASYKNRRNNPSREIPASFNANYKQHNHVWIQKRHDESDKWRTAKAIKEGRPIPEPKRGSKHAASSEYVDPVHKPVPYSTDDRTMDRFIKRYKWRG